jgi:isocitrate/isopropylmalate dehydrogenase
VSKSVLILPGDGIGPEIVTEAEKVLLLEAPNGITLSVH